MKTFYERVLPSQGVYCISGIDKNKKITNRFAESLAEVINVIEELKSREQNIFVAPGSFVGHSRRAEGSAFLRSFFIDLDVGPGKEYTDKQDALDALDYLLEQADLPEPVRVDSGGGIHAYWIFDRDIPSAEWKPYAEKFKLKVMEHIPIDPVVTADVARIMRCPDTLNYKYATPFETKVISTEIPVYGFDEMKDYLGLVTDPKAILAAAPKGLDEDTLKMLKADNIESVFQVIAEKSLNDNGCAQIKYMLVNERTLPEPIWHSGLSIARHCSDWEEAIHLMSMEYPKYDREYTIKKANETFGKPHSCATIGSRNPGVCDGCKFRGKITNPLALGRQLREAPPPTEEDAVREEQNPEEVYALTSLPDYLKPYQRGANGGIYYVAPAEQDKDGKWHQDDPVLLWEHDLWPIKRMFGAAEGECLLLRHKMPNDDVRDFLMPLKVAYSRDKFQELVSGFGVAPKAIHMPKLMDYITQWGRYMINKQSAEQTRMQMGWTSDNNGFVIGNMEIKRNGTISKTAASPLVSSIANILVTKGTYEKWREAVDKLNVPEMEMHIFPMLCGFGSPLMRFTSTRGVSVCYTAETGAAKTGALYAGASIFGDPVEQCLVGSKDESATENALTQWYIGLKNIMMCLDEASNRAPLEVSKLLHKVSSGKNKMRLQASVNAVREIEQTAAGIAFLTSNQSLTDKLVMLKDSPDGELARLVEFNITKPKPLIDNAYLGKEIFDTFRYHFGHAGPMYIQYLMAVGEEHIIRTIGKWNDRFIQSFGNDTAYRFYQNLIAIAFAAGELANEAQVIKVDLDSVYAAVISHLISNRENSVKLNNSDYESLLGDFQMRNQGGTLVINDERMIREPRMALVARMELDAQMYYVSKREFKLFLSQLQISEREFVYSMEKKGILVFKGKQRLAKGQPGMSSTAPVHVYGFKYEAPPELFASGD